MSLLRADGELTPSTASELLGLLARELEKRPWALVLDLTGLSKLDGRAVPALVDAARWAGETDIGLYLVAANDVVRPALQVAGVLPLFELHRGIDAALAALSRS